MARPKKITSLPDEAESALDDVVSRAVQNVEYLMEVLMPDGRPFGQDPKPIEQQLLEYQQGGYQTDIEACKNKIRMIVGQVTNTLMAFGIPPEEMALVLPYDIAESAALQWSAKMEKLLSEKAAQAPVLPTAGVEASAYGISG